MEKQKPIPKTVPTEGPCPVWSNESNELTISKENDMLKQKIIDLEKQLQKETDLADQCHTKQIEQTFKN